MTASHSPDSSGRSKGAKESFGTRIRNRFKAQSMKKRIVASISTLGVLALASLAVSPTVANWNSEEALGTNMQAGGNFGLQINTGNGWTNTGTATISFDDFAYWAPNDNQSQTFKLRMNPNSSHAGEIDFSSCGTSSGDSIRLSSSGRATDYTWSLQEDNMGARVQANRLDRCDFIPFGEPELILSPGEVKNLTLMINATPGLQQSQDTTFTMTFRADQLTHTQAP